MKTEQKYAAAALAVFKRYGVRKATMEEIAAEAGVSKPTLYATFRNKDAALGGAIRFAKGAALEDVLSAWENASSTAERLDIFFERLVLAGFDMLHNAPDAAAFDTAVGANSQEAIDATRLAEIEAVATIFQGSERLSQLGTDANTYANYVVSSAMNAKRLMQSREELENYLRVLKISALSVAIS